MAFGTAQFVAIQKCIANFVNLIISKRKTFIKSKIDFTIDKI